MYNEAILAYNKAIDKGNGTFFDDMDVCYHKGVALNHVGKYDEAIQAFDQAANISRSYGSPGYGFYLIAKADTLIRQGVMLNNQSKYNDASNCFDKAFEDHYTPNIEAFMQNYLKYIKDYPEEANSDKVQMILDTVLYKKAQENDWYSFYEDYIRYCPKGLNVQQAKERLKWLKENKAIVEIEYPKIVQTTQKLENKEYWEWDTLFKEKSGKVGFRVSGSGYIVDPAGKVWMTGIPYGEQKYKTEFIERGPVNVKAGTTGKNTWWRSSQCSDPDNNFCNGYAKINWTGEDAGGHPIILKESVKLQS
jgi:tetratricopeptide (TPR) repeat protein